MGPMIDGEAVQSCLRAFEAQCKRENWTPLDDPVLALVDDGGKWAHREACFVDDKVLADCRYCDEYRLEEERVWAKIEALRAADS